jgi:taurine dioxygenase
LRGAPSPNNDRKMLSVTQTGAALGAEIGGVDLRAIGESTFNEIRRAWLDHQVLLFRDQHLSDDQLVAFSRRFGTLEHAPIQENGRRNVEGHPEIYVVSNVIEDGRAIGSLGSGEAVWHTDMSYVDRPPAASALYALEVPQEGGDTIFSTMYGAWESLSEEDQRRLAGLRVKHDGTYNSGGYVREGVVPTADPRESPGALHPLVSVHPGTGRRHLYLGRRRHAYIEGLSIERSESILDWIWRQATRDELTWRHRWRVGDLVIWDNRCTMHRRDSFDPATRRVMHRTQIQSQPGAPQSASQN